MYIEGVRFVSLKSNRVKLIDGTWEVIRQEIANHFGDKQAGAFVMMHHCTWLGIYKDGKFIAPVSKPLEQEELRFARIFDDESECHIWRNGEDSADLYRLRIRVDEEDEKEELNAVEAKQLLWGSKLEDSPENEHWKVLKEKRGIELLIHEEILPRNIQVSEQKRLWLVTRNYIDYTESGQAGYVDSRFVRIAREED